MANYYFTYEITNVTRKEKVLIPYKYLGQHCTHDLNKQYNSSCAALKENIKNGDKIEFTPIKHYNNIYELGDAEYELIKERKAANDPIYYNKKTNRRYYNHYFEDGRDESFIIKVTGQKRDPSPFIGEKNPMYKKTIYDCWLKRYGKEIANEKEKQWKLNLKKSSNVWNKGLTKYTDERVKKYGEKGKQTKLLNKLK